jgi:hypothetical protein
MAFFGVRQRCSSSLLTAWLGCSRSSEAMVAETREAFYTDTTLLVASNREERRAPMEKLVGKPHRKREKKRKLVIR